jgi:glucose dehydrogenase
MARRMLHWILIYGLPIVITAPPAGAQHGAKNGEWRFYGGDAGTTKYSPLDQINASNVKDLKIVWQWRQHGQSRTIGRSIGTNERARPWAGGR